MCVCVCVSFLPGSPDLVSAPLFCDSIGHDLASGPEISVSLVSLNAYQGCMMSPRGKDKLSLWLAPALGRERPSLGKAGGVAHLCPEDTLLSGS